MNDKKLNKKELYDLSLFLKENILNSDIIVNNKNRFKELNNILITGATGNLGFELLNKIQNKNIHIIVRNKKLNEKLKELVNKKNVKVYLSSGLQNEYLGLSVEDYNYLKNEIDMIYHCAANVNNILSMEELYSDNIISTLNVIKFSIDTKIKLLHYMSTLSVFVSMENASHKENIKQDSLIANNEIPKNGYAATKVVCDFLCDHINNVFGNIKIYRLGLLLSENINRKSYIYQLIKNIKVVPKEAYHYSFDLTPIDKSVDFILTYKGNSSIINVSFNSKVSLLDLKNILNLEETTISELRKNGWIYEFLKGLHNEKVKHDIFEMTDIKGFEIDPELEKIEINKEYYIKCWLN